MNSLITRCLAAVSLMVLLIVLGTGCKHTAQGVGKDMEDAGEKIQEKTK